MIHQKTLKKKCWHNKVGNKFGKSSSNFGKNFGKNLWLKEHQQYLVKGFSQEPGNLSSYSQAVKLCWWREIFLFNVKGVNIFWTTRDSFFFCGIDVNGLVLFLSGRNISGTLTPTKYQIVLILCESVFYYVNIAKMLYTWR